MSRNAQPVTPSAKKYDPRVRTGGIETCKGKDGKPLHWPTTGRIKYRGRLRWPDGSRPGKAVPEEHCATEKAAREYIASVQQQIDAQGDKLLVQAAAIPDDGSAAAWVTLWSAERKRRGLTSWRENQAHYDEHIRPIVGSHVRDWTVDEMRALSRSLDAKVQVGSMKWKTAWNVWGTAHRMCQDACKSKHDELRVRDDNPILNVAGPDRGEKTSKQYLYPSEFLAFVSCEEVPAAWRRAVMLATYLFPRAGELRALRWEDVDLEHGTVHVHRARNREETADKGTKTKSARRFAVEPAILPLLRAMHEESGGVGHVIELPNDKHLARDFRQWLEHAQVGRAELHASTPTRKAMTFHDLRATGITWMAVRGDDPLKIMQRAGHSDFTTTQGYIREAEAVREGFGEVFPKLPLASEGPPDGGGGAGGKRPAPARREPPQKRGPGRKPTQMAYPSRSQVCETIVEAPGIETVESDATRELYGNSRMPDPSPTDTGDTSSSSNLAEPGELVRHPGRLGSPDDARWSRVEALATAVQALLVAGLTTQAAPLVNELVSLARAGVGPRAEVVTLPDRRAEREGGQ